MRFCQVGDNDFGGDSSKDDSSGGNEQNQVLARQDIGVRGLKPSIT